MEGKCHCCKVDQLAPVTTFSIIKNLKSQENKVVHLVLIDYTHGLG
jgi:hypothetical protein